MTKRCTRCGLDKSPSDFYADKRAADGLQAECKECAKARMRAHNSKPAVKARIRRQTLEWRANNPEALRVHGVRNSRTRHAKRRAELDAYKNKPCADCGRSYPPCVMDFDHRPGTTKTRGVGALLTYSRARREAEIAKCDVVCANCHRIRTWTRKDHGRRRTSP